MNLKYTTKLRKNSNSIVTTVPKNIVDLLKLQEGNKLNWTVLIGDKITVIVESKEDDN